MEALRARGGRGGVGSGARGRRRALVRALRARRRGGDPRRWSPSCRPSASRRTPRLAAALACAALDVGDTADAERHLRARRGGGGRPRAAAARAATWRRWRSPASAAARAGGRLRRRADRGRRAAGRGGGARRRRRTRAREALVRRHARRDRAVGHRLRPRAARSCGRAVTLARVAGLDYVAVSALSDLALLEFMVGGPARDPAHASEAIELAERRGWADIPQTACAHAALALARVLRPAAERRRRAPRAAPRPRPPRCASASLDFVLAHLGARMHGALGAPRDGAARARRVRRSSHRPTARAAIRAARSLGAMRARLLIAAGELDEADGGARRRSTGSAWLAVDLAPGRGCGWRAASRPRRSSSSPRAERPASAATTPSTASSAALLEAIAHDEAGEPARRRRARSSTRSRWPEATGHRWPFLELGRRMEELLRPQIRHGHRAPRDRRRAARRVRRPRAGRAHGHAAARAAQPSASRRSCATCRPRSPTARSPPSCSSRPTRSRRTCAASTASSTSPAGARPSSARATCGCSRPAHAADAAFGASASPTSPNGSGSQ